MNIREKREAGFTLLELLIVVSIIAILSVALVLVLDPAETLRKSRDAQRMSDLSTIKTALALYTTSTTTPILGAGSSGAITNTYCKATLAAVWNVTPVGSKIAYSLNGISGNYDGGTGNALAASATTFALTDGTGWIPVNLDNLTGGTPLSNFPVDPVNTVTNPALVTNADHVYRYGCTLSPNAFEISATLESTAYTVTENKMLKDGGNNDYYYEVGTNLKVLGNSVGALTTAL